MRVTLELDPFTAEEAMKALRTQASVTDAACGMRHATESERELGARHSAACRRAADTLEEALAPAYAAGWR
jgi:hypothetical protein